MAEATKDDVVTMLSDAMEHRDILWDDVVALQRRVKELEAAIRKALPNVYAMADPGAARRVLANVLSDERTSE